MLEAIAKLGVSGGIGLLMGIALVWWVEPTSTGGTVLLLVICIIASTVIGGVISGSKKQDAKSE